MTSIAEKTENLCGVPLHKLFKSIENMASTDEFLNKAVAKCIQEIKDNKEETEPPDYEDLGYISHNDLIDLLAEKIFMDVLVEACESKISSAKLRSATVTDRLKQLICDHFNLPDDEPIKIGIVNMKVMKGSREARIVRHKKLVMEILKFEEDELKETLEKEGKGTLEGDLADLILQGHREKLVDLSNAVFDAKTEDSEFLDKVINDEDLPKAIRYVADVVKKERGIVCRKKKTVEWH